MKHCFFYKYLEMIIIITWPIFNLPISCSELPTICLKLGWLTIKIPLKIFKQVKKKTEVLNSILNRSTINAKYWNRVSPSSKPLRFCFALLSEKHQFSRGGGFPHILQTWCPCRLMPVWCSLIEHDGKRGIHTIFRSDNATRSQTGASGLEGTGRACSLTSIKH